MYPPPEILFPADMAYLNVSVLIVGLLTLPFVGLGGGIIYTYVSLQSLTWQEWMVCNLILLGYAFFKSLYETFSERVRG